MIYLFILRHKRLLLLLLWGQEGPSELVFNPRGVGGVCIRSRSDDDDDDESYCFAWWFKSPSRDKDEWVAQILDLGSVIWGGGVLLLICCHLFHPIKCVCVTDHGYSWMWCVCVYVCVLSQSGSSFHLFFFFLFNHQLTETSVCVSCRCI